MSFANSVSAMLSTYLVLSKEYVSTLEINTYDIKSTHRRKRKTERSKKTKPRIEGHTCEAVNRYKAAHRHLKTLSTKLDRLATTYSQPSKYVQDLGSEHKFQERDKEAILSHTRL
jgi:hypothetical protein